MRTTFQDELNLLETTLHEEGALVLRALRGAINALEQRDHELADEVIAFDDDVDERYVQIEEGIQSLLARQTPVASDLRLVLAMLHINLHLERMADYCVTIAKLSKLVPEVEPSPRFIEGFEEMGARCEEMIRIAIDAFADRDLARAESLVELDELVDRANRRVVERILELGGDRDDARVRLADGARLAGARADRGSRCRHRRAGRLPADGGVPGVHGRVSPVATATRDRLTRSTRDRSAVARISLVPQNREFFRLLERASANAIGISRQLVDLLDEFPANGSHLRAVKELEHESDRLTREVVDLLNRTFVTPFDRDDIYLLAGAIDDVCDHIDEAAGNLPATPSKRSARGEGTGAGDPPQRRRNPRSRGAPRRIQGFEQPAVCRARSRGRRRPA